MTVRNQIAALWMMAGLAICAMTPALAAETTSSVIEADPAATEVSRRQANKMTAEEAQKKSAELLAGRKQPTVSSSPFETTETVVVATWNKGQLTNNDVAEILKYRKPRALGSLPPASFDLLDRTKQRDAVKDLVYEKVVLDEARTGGLTEKSPEVAKAIREARETILARMFYEREIEPRMRELTEESARDHYEEHKNDLYTQAGRVVVRDVFVSAYKEVEASKDDTLTSLASTISGDKDASSRILRGQSPYFFRAPEKSADAETLTAPLKEGEKLLVPLSEDDLASATEAAEKVKKALDSGKSAEEAVATVDGDFTATATGLLHIQGPGYWPEITAAVAKLGETSVSEVLKTPSGFHVLKLEEMTTTRVLNFDEVKDKIIGEVSADPQKARAAVENVRAATIGKLWDKFKVTMNTEILNSSDPGNGKPLPPETPIVTADGFTYTFSQALGDMRLTGKDWQGLTPQERIEVVRNSPSIVRYVVNKEAEALGLDKSPRFQQEMESKKIVEITNAWVEQQRATEAKVTEDDLRAYYSDHIEKYTSPSQVTLREISKRVNMNHAPEKRAEAISNAKKALLEIRGRIKTLADFEQAARRESEAISTRSRGGYIGTVASSFRGAPFENQINQLKPGDVSEPFLYGSEIMIIRIDDRIAPTPQPFEEVRRQVQKDYMQEVPVAKEKDRRENLLKKAGAELKF